MNSIMSDDPQRFLEVALEAVKLAEPIFIRSFGNASGVENKSDSSKVSAADKEIERILIAEIANAFPSHTIVGEEGGGKKGSSYTWYIDPIDGTTNYIHGIPHCAISVALWDAQGPLVGIVSNPIDKSVFTALRGGGAFKNGRPIRVSATTLLQHAIGTLGWDWRDRLSRNVLLEQIERSTYRWRVFSGSALEICFVASGLLDFFVSISIHNWDMAAAILVLTEAGGIATDRNGGEITPLSSTVVGTNSKIHSALVAALK